MAGFETVVRPVTFPNIRPTPKQSLPPQSDPEKGIAIIRGQPAQTVTTGFSWSVSSSTQNPSEFERQSDVARIYQKEPGGNVNKDNYVDIAVPNKIWMRSPSGIQKWKFTPVREADNIEVINRDVISSGE